MKKLVLMVILLLVCTNLASCNFFDALSYSISGDIINPVGDFSRGDDKGTFVYGEKNYILIDEVAGNFEFDIVEEDIFLGRTSNWPFFPDFGYYANAEENADYIASGSMSNGKMTCVYLREDLCGSSLCYVLQGANYEFDFSSAFVTTEEVSYETHIEGKNFYGTRLNFYVKDYPRLTVSLGICKINEKWYYVEQDEAFSLSEDFLNALIENDLLP